MNLIDEARKLLSLKQDLDKKETEYEDQRLIVHNQLVNLTPSQVDVDGFRIIKVDDRAQMRFDKDLLWKELKDQGLSDQQISMIMARSKEESNVSGIVRIIKL